MIQKGTTLAQDTIFSALRQEVVRRMSNTDKEVCWEERLSIIEDFIQLLVNSMHKYTLLQGISKYEYMCYRDRVDTVNPKYLPLHRAREFKREERLLTKYMNLMLWFQTNNHKDPYKQLWRRRVSRKGDSMKKNRRWQLRTRECNKKKMVESTVFLNRDCTKSDKVSEKLSIADVDTLKLGGLRDSDGAPKVAPDPHRITTSAYHGPPNDGTGLNENCLQGNNTKTREQLRQQTKTTMTIFVPQSVNSRLFKLVRDEEDRSVGEFGWRVKVLEQPGTPFLTKFIAKFPIREGCARGLLCKMCEGGGLKCTQKGVVYEGTCVTCKLSGKSTTKT